MINAALVAAAIATFMISASSSNASASECGTYVGQWGTLGAAPGQFDQPFDVAVDAASNVYVTDLNNHRVQKFDQNGVFIRQWGSFAGASGIAVDGDGFVYVTDRYSNTVLKFDGDGSPITQWGSTGTGDGQFNDVIGVGVEPTGKVLAIQRINPRVQRFTNGGVFVKKWGSFGTADGQFNDARDAAADTFDNIYVADSVNHRIQKFDSNGNFLAKWGSLGTTNGQMNAPGRIDIDATGRIFVTEGEGDRVQVFDSEGNFLTKWGTTGTGPGQFSQPFGVAVTPSGAVFVVDRDNNRIQKFDCPASVPSTTTTTLDTPDCISIGEEDFGGAATLIDFDEDDDGLPLANGAALKNAYQDYGVEFDDDDTSTTDVWILTPPNSASGGDLGRGPIDASFLPTITRLGVWGFDFDVSVFDTADNAIGFASHTNGSPGLSGLPGEFGFVGFECSSGIGRVQFSTHFPDQSAYGYHVDSLLMERPPGTCVGDGVFCDSFEDLGFSSAFWWPQVDGVGPAATLANGRLEISIPSTSSNGTQEFSARYVSSCRLSGDFDVEVEFQLLDWPFASGVRVGLIASQSYAIPIAPAGVGRISFGSANDFPGSPREAYVAGFESGVKGIVATSDQEGKLRVVRSQNQFTMYRWNGASWVTVASDAGDSGDLHVMLNAHTDGTVFTDQNVKIAFDGFRITSGTLVCPQCGDNNLDPGEACDDGNQIDGDGCDADCSVTPTTTTMPAVSCGDPGTPANGTRTGASFSEGSTLSFFCNSCYVLMGSPVRTCQNDATWSGTQPSCGLVNCGNPGVPTNGTKTGSSYTCSAQVTYGCNAGYALTGSSSATCQTNGLWSSALPSCVLALPSAPSGLAAASISTTRVDLSWSDNSINETAFKIERKVGTEGNYSQLATVSSGVRSYSDTTTVAAITYFYRVRASNAAGNSAFSAEASATTIPEDQNCSITYRLSTNATVGDIAWTTDYSSAPGAFAGQGVAVQCSGLIAGTSFTRFDNDATTTVALGLVSGAGLTGALDVATCTFLAGNTPISGNFSVTVTEAGDLQALPISPLPSIAISSIACGNGVCGNGMIETTEECDDGDAANEAGDYCLASCLRAPCGAPTRKTPGNPSASDALFTLRAAVGVSHCDLRVCDVNASDTLTATDALNVLRAAVGIAIPFSCPPELPTIPSSPSNLAAVSVAATQVNLSWTDNSNNESGFKIERKTGAGGTYSQIATVGTSIETYSDTSVSAATTYFYRVRAYNSAGNSSFSNQANVSTPTAVIIPMAPSGLGAVAISATRVDLSWNDNSNSETGFKVERKTGAGGSYSQIGSVGADIESYSDTSVSPSTTYYYRVRAYNSAGNSSFSNESNASTPAAVIIPAPPSGLGAVAVSAARVDLSWSDNSSNETGFKVERKTGAGGSYSQISTVGAGSESYSDTSVSASTTYYYRVRSYNSAGNSSFSNESNATTPVAVTCPLNGPLSDLRNDCSDVVYYYVGDGLAEGLNTTGTSILIAQTDGTSTLGYFGTVTGKTTFVLTHITEGTFVIELDPGSNGNISSTGFTLNFTVKLDGSTYSFNGATFVEAEILGSEASTPLAFERVVESTAMLVKTKPDASLLANSSVAGTDALRKSFDMVFMRLSVEGAQ